MESTATTTQTLPKVSEVFKMSWQLWKERMRASLMLVCILLALNLLSLAPLPVGLDACLAVVNIVVSFIVGLAYCALFLKEEPLTAVESILAARRYLVSYLWISILMGLIVLSGSILLIIPGIWLAFLFNYVPASLVDMGYKGRMALAHSWHLVRGYWWKVFILVVSLYIFGAIIIGITGLLLDLFFSTSQSLTFSFCYIFIAPYVIAFQIVIYRALKNIKGDISGDDAQILLKKIKNMLVASIIILAILIVGIIFAVVKYAPDIKKAFEQSQQSKQLSGEDLIKISDEANTYLPKMIDDDTSLDSTTALDNTFTYKYTVVNYQKEDMNEEELRNNLYPQIRNVACTSQELKVFRDGGVLMNYNYYDKDGDFVLSIEIDTKSCP